MERPRDGSRILISAVRINPGKFHFRVLNAPDLKKTQAAWLHEMAAETGAVVAINGSFYLPEQYQYEPTGLVVSEGKVLAPWRKGAGSGLFRVKGDHATIDWAKQYNPKWEHDDVVIQAGPILVEPGKVPGIYSNSGKFRARTAAAIDPDGNVIFICTSSGFADGSGLDIFELMQIMIQPEKLGGLGVERAINLDGGTSSTMVIEHTKLKITIKAFDQIHNGIGVFRK